MAVDRSDLDDVFGKTVIDKWADLENEGDATHIANRCAWAIALAVSHVQSKMRLTTYAWSDIQSDPLVEHAIAIKAGLLLHMNRANSDSDGNTKTGNPVGKFEKLYKEFFVGISSGEIVLGDNIVDNKCKSYPHVRSSTANVPVILNREEDYFGT